MSLGCAGCGDCCDPVWLDLDEAEKVDQWRNYLDRVAARDWTSDSIPFILAHWTEIERNEKGARYRCDRFDPESRRCTAHDARPDVCRGYPWYGGGDDAIRAHAPLLSRRCSFLLDVPSADRGPDARPLIPISVAASPPRPRAPGCTR